MKTGAKCGGAGCGCPPSKEAQEIKAAGILARRDFLKLVGLSGAAAAAGSSLLMLPSRARAGDFTYLLIPANKNLDPNWVASLFARGTPTVYTGAALRNIGMPVGGVCCGQLYLRGDGRLWFWDICNSPTSAMLAGGGGGNYDSPFDSSAPPVNQGFALKVGSGAGASYFSLDQTGFANVAFTGQYPIGVVNYSDPACPVSVKLEAYSPFIPLNDNDSGIPATIFEFTLTNTSASPVQTTLAGWLQNAACAFTPGVDGILLNHAVSATDHLAVVGSVQQGTASAQVLYDDFERTTYAPWVTTGTAFGTGPVDTTNYPSSSYQTLAGFHGRYVVNSHASAPGTNSTTRDQATGTLTSPAFTLSYDLVYFLLCGGNHAGQTCFNLCRASDNTVLISSTGSNSNTYTQQSWDVSAWKGQSVYFQVVDNATGSWGNIGVDYIRFANKARADIVFDDFERTTYTPWVTSGTAFGSGPVDTTNYPSSSYQTLAGFHGRYVVNSHASAPGTDVNSRDAATGTLTSPSFTISRHFISFLISGGNHPGQTCMNLVVGGQVVCTAAGTNSNTYTQATWDVRAWEGQTGYLQIVDNATATWGNIGIDYIVFSDTPVSGWVAPADAPDYGTMGLSLLNPQASDVISVNAPTDTLADLFASLGNTLPADVTQTLSPNSPLVMALGRPLTLNPGAQATATFAIVWHFPKTQYNTTTVTGNGWGSIQNIGTLQRYYSTLFADASAVAAYVAANFTRLGGLTHLWRDTWYASTLPYWFLDRTFANTSTLATTTSHRLSNGRFWGWEGMYCCPGTCTHVWHYGQAMGRIFPAIEKDLRQRVDLGIAFNSSTGQIGFRAENSMSAAVDGQAGVILRAYRDHQMSADSSFLTTNWANLKKAMQWLISLDLDANGILQGGQPNTLDASWYGKIAWLSGLYIAACRACQQMATEMGDTPFATQLGNLAQAGATYIQNQLFYNNEYFIQIPDDSNNNIGAKFGCEIDQVFGQSWAFQVGLGRLLDQTKTLSALARLWTYNFAPDAGAFRTNASNPVSGGRVYTDSGEAGLVMCTFPDPANPTPSSGVVASYFNETMSGFEHEVASHMIWEGMLLEGLAITRAIHDRYAASKRNPYNEIECGDHYARAMASYGSFIAICGYEHHGPKGYLAFSPKLAPENFKAAFTTAAGWGSFAQQQTSMAQIHTLVVGQGQLALNTLAFDLAPNAQPGGLSVSLNGTPVNATMSQSGVRVTIAFASQLVVQVGQTLVVQITGTAMLNPAWVFAVVQVTPVGGGVQLVWNSVPGRTYTIQSATGLPAASWTTLQTGWPAVAGATTSFIDRTAASSGNRFYRVMIESP